MKQVLTAITLVLLTACAEENFKTYTQESIRGDEDAASFIVKCSKAANPMSDEEGEDLVQQCEDTAKRIYGTREYYGYLSQYNKGCFSFVRQETAQCLIKYHKEFGYE